MTETAEWQPTACILCECNCGIEVQTEGSTLAKIRGDKAHPGSRGYTCNKAMRLDHYQNGPAPAHIAAAAPARRQLRGDRLGHGDRRDRRGLRRHRRAARRRVDLLLRRRRPGQPPRRRLQRLVPEGARRAPPLQRARAGEDGRGLGGRAARRWPHTRRVRARRGVGLRRQEPVDVAELPAGARRPARDRQGPRAVDDRASTPSSPTRRSSPTSTCGSSPAPTPGAWPRWRRCSSRRTWSTGSSSTSAPTAPQTVLAALRRRAHRRLRRALRRSTRT